MLAALRHRGYKQAILRRLDGSEPAAILPAGGQTERRLAEALFVIMGHLAKLDGRVTRAEIDFANTMIGLLGLCATYRAEAIAWFDYGKQNHIDAMPYLQPLVSSIGARSELAYQFLRVQCRFALMKGVMHLQEKMVLRDIAEILGFDKSELLEICMDLRPVPAAQSHHVSSVLCDAYTTLEIERDAIDSDIRKAYLRQMSRYHPDKIRRSNLTPESLRVAQEQSTAVRAAYETICGFRKIRA